MIHCEACKKKPATVHITEVVEHPAAPDEAYKIEHKDICESCAASLNLAHSPPVTKSVIEIWKLLEQSAKSRRQQSDVACPDCGMTLREFRSRGRLGCPRDYEVFHAHLDPLLQRIHNAERHVGRLPGLDASQIERMQQIHDLRERLETAIRDEEYEDAARLRDELQQLERTEGA